VFNAMRQVVPHEAVPRLFQVTRVTDGTAAQAQVSVRLEDYGYIATGESADTDTLTASPWPTSAPLNHLFARKEKSAPAPTAPRRF
jgi:2-isopropylmalate synthase